jgi:hypothetical protein
VNRIINNRCVLEATQSLPKYVQNVDGRIIKRITIVMTVGSHLIQVRVMSSSGPSPLENLQENIGDEDQSPKELLKGMLMGVGMAIPIFGMGGAILNSSEPVSGFVSGMLLAIILGAIFIGVLMTDMSGSQQQQQQQQQQVGDSSESTIICPECGWKNPESNNYCNDCGFSFDSGESDE